MKCALFLFASMTMANAPLAFAEEVEIIRDQWGIPHVYAQAEEALFYGAGYAMAEDRMMQMMLMRRKAQGRLSEILGLGKEGVNLHSDIVSVTMNLAGHAKAELGVMEAADRNNLEAFAAGINAYLKEKKGKLSPLFAKYGGDPEPWSADHSLAIWARLSADFSWAWTMEARAKRKFEKDPESYRKDEVRKNSAPAVDDAAAIVAEKEFKRAYPETYKKLMKAKQTKGSGSAYFQPPAEPQSVKASHNWVVSGKRSTTGKPMLTGKPQLTVQNPNTTYEIHLTGGRYNVRGMTWPGEPGILVGFNEHCSWAATAMNTDSGDLFEEKINPANPNQYRFKDRWLEFEHRKERILVKGGKTTELDIRESIHGPVVNHLIEGEKPGEIFTLKSTFAPLETSSVNAMLKMMRARDWKSFRDGMRDYVAPGAHIVYGDVHGDIGYQSLARIPTRDFRITLPRKGWTGEEEWEMLPFEYMPSLLNPEANYTSTANGLNVGAWHPFATTNGYGGGPRSMRLRELFAGDRVFSINDIITDVHRDTVTPALRDFVTLVLAVIKEDSEKIELDKAILEAAQRLKAWDGRSRTDSPNFAMANAVLTVIQSAMTKSWHMDRTLQYGGGWSGLSAMFRELMAHHRKTGKGPEKTDQREWLLDTLEKATKLDIVDNPGWDPSGIIHSMPYQNNNTLGSLAPEHDLDSPPMLSGSTHTIWSQRGETYVQIVDHSNVDRSLAFLPSGISEDPSSPHYEDQTIYWQEGTLRAAPLSRYAVESLKESVTKLKYPGKRHSH